MQHSDDKLVQLTLEGDHDAFAALVKKYQSQIHALAWRKINDFHILSNLSNLCNKGHPSVKNLNFLED